mgnify:CR=1 FL=1
MCRCPFAPELNLGIKNGGLRDTVSNGFLCDCIIYSGVNRFLHETSNYYMLSGGAHTFIYRLLAKIGLRKPQKINREDFHLHILAHNNLIYTFVGSTFIISQIILMLDL